MKKLNFFLICILFSISISFGGGASFDPNNTNPIGIEFLENKTVVHIWNPDDDYFFNASSGIQFSNHYNEYWTHNIFCGGYKDPTEGWLYDCNDELPFTWSWETDNATYVNITGYRDKTISGRTVRIALRYHLGLNDTKLSIILYMKNIGDLDVPYDVGFAWRVNNIKVSNDVYNDQLLINKSYYWLNDTLDLSFVDMSKGEYKIVDFKKPNYVLLQWDNSLNYKVVVRNQTGQYNAPITLGINAGPLSVGQEKKTIMYWKDAVEYLVPVYDINYTGWETTDPGNKLYWSEVDESVFSPDESDYIYNTENNSVIRFGLSNCPSNFDPVTNLSVMMYGAPDYDYDGQRKLYEFTVYWTADDGATYSSPLSVLLVNSTPKIYNFTWDYISLTQEQCDNLQLEIRGVLVNGTQQNREKIFAISIKVDNATVQFNLSSLENFTFNYLRNQSLTAKQWKDVNITTYSSKTPKGTFPNTFPLVVDLTKSKKDKLFSYIKPKNVFSIFDTSSFSFLAINKFLDVANLTPYASAFLNASQRFAEIVSLNDAKYTVGYFYEQFQNTIQLVPNRITSFFGTAYILDSVNINSISKVLLNATRRFVSTLSIYRTKNIVGYFYINLQNVVDIFKITTTKLFASRYFSSVVEVNSLMNVTLNAIQRLHSVISLNGITSTFGQFYNNFYTVIEVYNKSSTYLFAPVSFIGKIVVSRVSDIPYLFALHSPIDIIEFPSRPPIHLIYVGVEHFKEVINFNYMGRKHVFYPSSAEEIECFGHCPSIPVGGGQRSPYRNEFSVELDAPEIGYSVDNIPVDIVVGNKEKYKDYPFQIDLILLDENNTMYNYEVINGTMVSDIIQIHTKMYLPLASTGKELKLIARGVATNYITEKEKVINIVMINVFVFIGIITGFSVVLVYFKYDAKQKTKQLIRKFKRAWRSKKK